MQGSLARPPRPPGRLCGRAPDLSRVASAAWESRRRSVAACSWLSLDTCHCLFEAQAARNRGPLGISRLVDNGLDLDLRGFEDIHDQACALEFVASDVARQLAIESEPARLSHLKARVEIPQRRACRGFCIRECLSSLTYGLKCECAIHVRAEPSDDGIRIFLRCLTTHSLEEVT